MIVLFFIDFLFFLYVYKSKDRKVFDITAHVWQLFLPTNMHFLI